MYPTLLGWIIIGTIAGWLTGKLMRGVGYGILMDLILGLIGAVIGGWLDIRPTGNPLLWVLGQFGCRHRGCGHTGRDYATCEEIAQLSI